MNTTPKITFKATTKVSAKSPLGKSCDFVDWYDCATEQALELNQTATRQRKEIAMNPNKFKGHCAHCQSTVPARAGVVVRIGRDWRVYCQAHKAQAQAAQPAEYAPDRFDMMIEDQMRDACGC